ncbi:MAG: lipopolysaccharide kinase InaA family protein [Candidatus Nanoarchaeia archaeon]
MSNSANNLSEYKTAAIRHFRKGNIEALINTSFVIEPIDNIVLEPEKYLSQSNLIKNSRSVSAGIWKHDKEKSVFINRYNHRGVFHSFRYAFKECRAFKSFKTSLKFNEHNIPAPSPIAAIKEKFFVFTKKSYLFLEAIENAIPTADFFQEAFKNPELLNIYIYNVASILAKIHKANISHGDAKLSNFFVSCAPGIDFLKCKFGIWDFDSATIFSGRISEHAIKKDISRTLASFREMSARINTKIECNKIAETLYSKYIEENGFDIDFDSIIKAAKKILIRKNLSWT